MSTSCLNIRVAGKYTLMKKLGEGAFGEIYLAQCIGTGEHAAVKLVTART